MLTQFPDVTISDTRPDAASALAVGSFLAGVIGMIACPLLGFPAIVLGLLALRKGRDAGDRAPRRGFALAGVICGAIGVLITGPAVASMAIHAYRIVREETLRPRCEMNLHAIGTALLEYTVRGQGMPTVQTLVAQKLVREDEAYCPMQDKFGGAYRLFAGAGGADEDQMYIVEPADHHLGKGHHVLYADGRVVFVPAAEPTKQK